MDLRFVEGVGHLVREDASRQTRDKFLGMVGVRRVQDVVVDKEVFTQERQLVIRDKNLSHETMLGAQTLYFMFLKRPPTDEYILMRYTAP